MPNVNKSPEVARLERALESEFELRRAMGQQLVSAIAIARRHLNATEDPGYQEILSVLTNYGKTTTYYSASGISSRAGASVAVGPSN